MKPLSHYLGIVQRDQSFQVPSFCEFFSIFFLFFSLVANQSDPSRSNPFENIMSYSMRMIIESLQLECLKWFKLTKCKTQWKGLFSMTITMFCVNEFLDKHIERKQSNHCWIFYDCCYTNSIHNNNNNNNIVIKTRMLFNFSLNQSVDFSLSNWHCGIFFRFYKFQLNLKTLAHWVRERKRENNRFKVWTGSEHQDISSKKKIIPKRMRIGLIIFVFIFFAIVLFH